MQHVRVGLESRGLFDASSDVSDPKKDASDFKSEAKRAKDATSGNLLRRRYPRSRST
jgi:hypothetical protein